MSRYLDLAARGGSDSDGSEDDESDNSNETADIPS